MYASEGPVPRNHTARVSASTCLVMGDAARDCSSPDLIKLITGRDGCVCNAQTASVHSRPLILILRVRWHPNAISRCECRSLLLSAAVGGGHPGKLRIEP